MNTGLNNKSDSKAVFGFGWGTAILLVVLAWAAAVTLRGGEEKVEIQGWQQGLANGKVLAQQREQPMLVMFTADWCGPCQVFKREVLSQPAVKAKIGERFIPVIADVTQQSESNPDFVAAVQQYKVSGVPTLIAMTPEGEVLGRTGRNDMSEAGFLAWLDRVPK